MAEWIKNIGKRVEMRLEEATRNRIEGKPYQEDSLGRFYGRLDRWEVQVKGFVDRHPGVKGAVEWVSQIGSKDTTGKGK